MWPVFVLQFNFRFLRNDAGGMVHLIILFLYWFWTTLHVLGCIRKLGITPFRGMFQLVNVANTCLAIKFRVLTYYIGWQVHLLTSLSTYSGLLSNIIFILLLSTTSSTNSTMLSQNSSEKQMKCAVFRQHVSEFSHWHSLKLHEVISNSNIKLHNNLNPFPFTTTTTIWPPTAAIKCPGQCPYLGQPKASSLTSTISCTTPPPPLCSSTHIAYPSNHMEDNNNELGGLKESEKSD